MLLSIKFIIISLCFRINITLSFSSLIISSNNQRLSLTSSKKTLRFPPTHNKVDFSFNSYHRINNKQNKNQLISCNNLFFQSNIFADNVALLPSLGLNSFLFLFLRKKILKLLTPTGFYHSIVLGTLLYMTLGWKGWTCAVLYLFLGSFVTKVKFEEKKKLGIEEKREGRRGPENVWGSALTGLCVAFAARYVNASKKGLFILSFVASFATKLSDTFASEIGKAFGKTTYLITTMEKVPPGSEGAISLEGTIAALFGAFLIPCYAFFIDLISSTDIVIATFAAFLATFAESWIGASLQNKTKFMTNEVVNFFNTLIGAALAFVGGCIFH